MNKKFLNSVVLLVSILTLVSFSNSKTNQFSVFTQVSELEQLSVQDVLVELGDKKPLHYLTKVDADSVRMGYEMVYFGQLKDKSNKRISKFFVCTDCHNQVKDVADLSKDNADERLKHGMKNNIPFLPASTFYGMYNKEHWYNGDYSKKYGDLVIPTRDSLDNAIQLCAVQCSQGRELENWELRAIIHYYKSIEYKISDLNLSQKELNQLLTDLAVKNNKAVIGIKQKYLPINNATFGQIGVFPTKDYIADPEKGKYIYEKGCLHCHGMGKDITNFEFDSDKLTFSFLDSKMNKHSHYSIPYIVRKGTYAVSGHKQYMPQYPLEKMSENQMVDLIEYIKIESNK